MARHLRTILVLVLLAGTAAAFVVAEDLKLEPDPIARPRITPTFSPICRCEQATARIAFRLRQRESLTLTIEDAAGRPVRTVLRNATFERGRHEFGWDGRNESGNVVPEGRYRPRVELGRLDRTIEFPKEIVVDTTPARVEVTRFRRRVISPDGDGRLDKLRIEYRAAERVHALLFVGGRREAKTDLRRSGAIIWSPRNRRAGVYRLTVASQDAAGNRGPETGPFDVRIRYVEIRPQLVRVRPRRRFAVRIFADARRYSWRLGRLRGSAQARVLRLRAPARPGRYRLVAAVSGRRDSSVVVVRRVRRP